MAQQTHPGKNRTGIRSDPERSEEMLRGMEEFPPDPEPLADARKKMAAGYATRAAGVGSLPFTDGRHLTVLVDKIAARLGFERTGVRLYQGILDKLDALGSFEGGPTREQMQRICDQEHQHFRMLHEVMDELGADATAITPAADLEATAAEGIGKVIGDPRTSVLDCVQAALIVELTDNASWETLIELARRANQSDLIERFENALAEERDHLRDVRGWVEGGLGA
jgi:rubrerythrin